MVVLGDADCATLADSARVLCPARRTTVRWPTGMIPGDPALLVETMCLQEHACMVRVPNFNLVFCSVPAGRTPRRHPPNRQLGAEMVAARPAATYLASAKPLQRYVFSGSMHLRFPPCTPFKCSVLSGAWLALIARTRAGPSPSCGPAQPISPVSKSRLGHVQSMLS